MGKYFDDLKASMTMLGKHPDTIFIGQAVSYPGTGMYGTLADVPMEKRLELPVAEEMQMGMSIGLALEGFIPISIFPRWNFLLLGINQLVNHLDKIGVMSDGGYKPGVIIRTGIGSERPLHPGPQHTGDFTSPMKQMLDHIWVQRLGSLVDIQYSYKNALEQAKKGKSTILVEVSDYLHEK